MAEHFIAAYASTRHRFQHAVALDRSSLGAHLHNNLNTSLDPALVRHETVLRS